MTKRRSPLPQLGGDFFMTDGGIETTLVFLEGLDLPHFAAFHLLKTPQGEGALRKYFATYAELATLAEANRKAVRQIEEIRSEYETPGTPIVISGCVGPRGDGYIADRAMSEEEAADQPSRPGCA
jgi:homocysteine S-methyltransferase